MYKIILIIFFATNIYAQSSAQKMFFFDDTTGTSWEGVAKGNLYASDKDGSTEYASNSAPSLLLSGKYSLQETFSDGDYTSGNVWTVSTGSYAVVDSVGYSGLAKSLRCATAGIIYIPCNQSYGSWEFDLKKGGDGNTFNLHLMESVAGVTGSGYLFQNSNSERLIIYQLPAASIIMRADENYTAKGFINYRIKITRSTSGSFSTYIKGGVFGDTYTLITVTSGTNPATDNTYTLSNYFVLDLDAGDMIANIVCEYGSGSMDLNAHELTKYPYQNSTFEGADTTYFANNGTHSIDTSRTQKYAGTYSGKMIATGVGDSTTNFISLASTQFTPLVAGEKYTMELWVNADSTGNGFTTKPRLTIKIGNQQSSVSDTISYYPGQFEKIVWNFQATSAEVGAPFIKIFSSQADTIYIDNFSLTQAKDIMVNQWVKTTDTDGAFFSYSNAGSASQNGYTAYLNTNQVRFLISTGTGNSQTINSGTINGGAWKLLNIKVKRVTDSLYISLDGGTETRAYLVLGKQTNTNAFAIGAMFAGTVPITAQIGETQITTFTDIATVDKTPSQIYQRGKNKVPMYSSYTGGSIVGWWKWSGSTDAVFLNDESSSANDLTGTNLTQSADQVTITSGY